MSTEPVLEANAVSRAYGGSSDPFPALTGVSLQVAAGEVVAVVGPSGSGKSTLLALLGGLDLPDRGTVRVARTDWRRLAGNERATFLRRRIGYMAQGLAMLPQATVTENVELPLVLDHGDATGRSDQVAAALAEVGLAAHADKLSDQLSGGEQQRVAIARALIHRPAVLLADEPTASLDSVTAATVVRLLVAAARDRGAAVVLVTHDPAIAALADRTVALRSGRVVVAPGVGVR